MTNFYWDRQMADGLLQRKEILFQDNGCDAF
jgi:hypothetical protein